MKQRLITLLIAILTIGTALPLAAREKPTDEQRRKWMAEMQEYKKEYIVKTLQLTDAQKARFIPLYDSMNKEIRQLQNNARQAERNVRKKGAKATDAEYKAAADLMFKLRSGEGAIEQKYYKQFKAILNAQQLYELKPAEDKFVREMMKHHRKKKKK